MTLLDALAAFLEGDSDAFTSGFVPTPEPRYFPDRFTEDVPGLTRLAMRLHLYLGIEHIRPVLEFDLMQDVTGNMLAHTETGLVTLRSGEAHYVVTRLGRADDAALSLLHEAARCALMERDRRRSSEGPFRENEEHDLEPPTSAEHHASASIYAVSRGLGLLVLAGSRQIRTASRSQNRMPITETLDIEYGGLSQQDAALLAAVHLRLRSDLDLETALAVLPEPAQRLLRRHYGDLQPSELLERLALPAAQDWPTPRSLPVPSLPELRLSPAMNGVPNSKVPALRKVSAHTALGAWSGAGLWLGSQTVLPHFVDGTLNLIWLVASIGTGIVAGKRWVVVECAGCSTRTTASATACERCKRPFESM